jgi:MinD superfamily P-loop ATPase
MKQLVILSGKGGTGKTTIAASFAILAEDAVTVDADVDAADLHLLLQPEVKISEEFVGGRAARINPDLCNHCDMCREACRFTAITGAHVVDSLACEGCGLCARICPAQAITMQPVVSGQWFNSTTRAGPMVHARLGIAAENSGKLVSQIRQQALEVATASQRELIIIDGSPGIGCPVIASMTGCDLALAITEPTVSGLHDLTRIAILAKHFGIPMVVALNKADLSAAGAAELQSFCRSEAIPLVGQIPFDEAVVGAIVAGTTLVEHSNGPAATAVRALWNSVRKRLFSSSGSSNATTSSPEKKS